MIIESPQNQRVKNAVKLRKSKHRSTMQKTLVEGCREIDRAFTNGWQFDELYFCPDLFLSEREAAIVQQITDQGTPTYQCSEAAFLKMTYRDTPDGLIALSPLVGRTLDELELPENPLLLIAQNLEKPGNLGTILRTADATGVDAVIACDPKTDLNNPNVIRASIGTLFFIPVAEATTEETFRWLEKNNIKSVAAAPDANQEYTQIEMTEATAIVVGAEDEGLSNRWLNDSNHTVSIPMLGKNDSLNVSTAAAIMLYEAIRQRRKISFS